MEKGQGKGTDTLQTDNVFTRKEYIEREAAIDALQNHYEVRNAVQNGIMDECVMLMMRVPAADVVPVVRCKDCKHYVPAEDNGEMMCVKDADWCVGDGCYYGFTDSHDADWFCADGERKDGGGE